MEQETLRSIIEAAVKKQLEVSPKTTGFQVKIGVSARHVHLTEEHFEMLFGHGAQLHPQKELLGGQFAAKECVSIVGTNLRVIENVRILGPYRKATQVEIAKTDAIRLGLNPPVRESGFVKQSSPITVVGPKGAVYLDEGCIVAKRHIHLSEDDAHRFGVSDGMRVSVEVKNERSGVFSDVLLRVHPSFSLEMHIDTDEANALGVQNGDMALVVY